mgnify:CR=1 FL=1
MHKPDYAPPYWLDAMFHLIDGISDRYSWSGGYRNPYPLPTIIAIEELSYIEDSLIATFPFITPTDRTIILNNLRYLSLDQARSYRVVQRSTDALRTIHAVIDRIFTQHPTLINQDTTYGTKSGNLPDTGTDRDTPEG